MYINNLSIEITRRCNLKCSHCMRGNTQSIDISDETLNTFFRRIRGSCISCLNLTGGEPSLALDRIKAVRKYITLYNVEIGNFYLVTNAKNLSSEFIAEIINLHSMCTDNEISQVCYSNDEFHEQAYLNGLDKLELLTFVSPRSHKDYPLRYNLINEGRAENNYSGRDIILHNYEIEEDRILEDLIYLNCKGDILPSCDLSYKSQKCKDLILCNVKDEDFDLIKACTDFNDKLDSLRSGTSQITVREIKELEEVLV